MPASAAARARLVSNAEAFRGMHHGPGILVLPNAWDAASARIFERAGFPAIATTSAGIAAALGYPDGERVPAREMLGAVRRIAHAVDVPVTADVEAGYGSPEETATAVLRAGAIGINLEDVGRTSLIDSSAQILRIKAVRAAAQRAGIPLVINARTDVYLLEVGPPESRFDEAVRRANLYRDAGADCLFIPGVGDAETIARLVHAVRGPLNILATAGVPDARELERLGVARVSTGSGPMRAALTFTRTVAEELKAHGTYDRFTRGVLTYAEVNRLMDR